MQAMMVLHDTQLRQMPFYPEGAARPLEGGRPQQQQQQPGGGDVLSSDMLCAAHMRTSISAG